MKIGIFFFLAEIVDKQLLVSPKTRNASGFILSSIGSIFINISPIVSDVFLLHLSNNLVVLSLSL